MSGLGGQVVAITGGAGGIGLAIARRMRERGASVALIDRDGERLAIAQNELGREGVSLHTIDLTDFDALPALAKEVAAAHGGINVLVNNAGLTVHGMFRDHTEAQIREVLDVDLRAVLLGTHAFLPFLRASKRGHVVMISSMAGFVGVPFQSVYSTAKFGVRGFGQSLRAELAAEGIGVTTIKPGAIATPFMTRADSVHHTGSKLGGWLERFGTSPTRVAAAVERGIVRNCAEIRVGWDSHATAVIQAALPPVIPMLLRWGVRRSQTT